LPDVEDVFTVLFEYCRVSDSALDWILENLIPNKLTSGFDNIWRSVVSSLAQVMSCQISQSPTFNAVLSGKQGLLSSEKASLFQALSQ